MFSWSELLISVFEHFLSFTGLLSLFSLPFQLSPAMIGNAFWIQFLWLCMSFLAHTQNTIVVTTVTTAPSQPTNEPSYVDDGAFRDAVLNSTNLFRNEHNASSLAWNDSLTDFGDDYVDGCQWKHSGGPYGENLAQGYEDVSRAVDGWGNERKDYDFNAGQFGETTGHFTQLVWKGTNTVGCGRKFCNGENDVQGW